MSPPPVFYNENDQQTAEWLRQMIALGELPAGTVDTRSITEIDPDELRGFVQCHFFAGIGGWALAARLAGWPADRPLWTGSCPCQPISVAGKRRGADDPRHLWPDFFRLITAARPPVVVGEQVAGALGYHWFDGVRADLAGEAYASRCVDIPSCAVDAPNIRQRLYWVAVADAEGVERGAGLCEAGAQLHGRVASDGDGARNRNLVHPSGKRRREGEPQPELWSWGDAIARPDAPGNVGDAIRAGLEGQSGHGAGVERRPSAAGPASATDGGDVDDAGGVGRAAGGDDHAGDVRAILGAAGQHGRNGSWWSGADWIACHDGKARRVADASAPLLVDGFPNRVLAWRGLGNAINPVLAAEVIGALIDSYPGEPGGAAGGRP